MHKNRYGRRIRAGFLQRILIHWLLDRDLTGLFDIQIRFPGQAQVQTSRKIRKA